MLAINSNYNQKTSFTGLTTYLQKTVFSPADVKKLAEKVCKNNFVGNLPQEWIEKIPKQQRPQTIKEVFEGFRNFAHLVDTNPQVALTNLETTLKNAKILSVDKSIKLKFEGSGTYGRVYRLDGLENQKTGEQYVIKMYNENGNHAQANGIFAELNRGGLYWPKAAGNNTQMVRTFFGDLESGFAVNKFIDDSLETPKRIIPSKLVGLESYDDLPKQNLLNNLYSLNVINGHVVDHGCLRVVCPELTNSKDARYVIKKIFLTPKDTAFDKWIEFLSNPAYKNDTNVKVALVEALEYLQPSDRTKGFEELLKRFSKNQHIRKYLAKNIKFIQDEDFTQCYSKLWKISETPQKIELLENIGKLPEKLQRQYLTQASREKELIFQVVNKFDSLPQDELIPLFNSSIRTSDDESKIKLFQKLFLLPKEMRLEYAKQILQNIENANSLGEIEQKTHILGLNDSQDYKKACEFLITDAKDTTKIFIINKILKKLEFENYLETVKLLAKDSSESIKFKLAPILKEIVQNKKIKKEDLDFIYRELSKNTDNQRYLDYLQEVFRH